MLNSGGGCLDLNSIITLMNKTSIHISTIGHFWSHYSSDASRIKLSVEIEYHHRANAKLSFGYKSDGGPSRSKC